MYTFETKGNDSTSSESRPTVEDVNCSTLAQIAQHVAKTGEILNINDTIGWLKEHGEYRISDENSDESKCVLCMPIVNSQKTVIGVLVYVHVG